MPDDLANELIEDDPELKEAAPRARARVVRPTRCGVAKHWIEDDPELKEVPEGIAEHEAPLDPVREHEEVEEDPTVVKQLVLGDPVVLLVVRQPAVVDPTQSCEAEVSDAIATLTLALPAMLPKTASPLPFPVQDVIKELANRSEDPACEEEERSRAAAAAASSPEGLTSEAALGDEGAENLPCQADSCTVRPKQVLLNEVEAECECTTPHSLEPQPKSWP